VDSWIVSNSILKVRFDSIKDNPDLVREWEGARKNQIGSGVLPKAMLRALQEGRFTDEDANALRDELWDTAITRVETVRRLWSALRVGDKRTLASHWAAGEVIGHFPMECFDPDPKRHDPKLYAGIAPGRKPNDPVTTRAHLGDLIKPIDHLIDDAIDYIRWTLAWPQFVQIVRSVRQGSFRGDMSWPSSPTS
jgi:hypothetical protein